MNDESNFTIKSPTSLHDWEMYHEIRTTNLFAPLNIQYDRDHPSLRDPSNHHYLFLKNEKVIGTLQIETLQHNSCAIRTIAINDPHKNKGYGSLLLLLAEEIIKEFKCTMIHLHSNPKAVSFYQKNGYSKMEFPNDPKLHAKCIDMGKVL